MNVKEPVVGQARTESRRRVLLLSPVAIRCAKNLLPNTIFFCD